MGVNLGQYTVFVVKNLTFYYFPWNARYQLTRTSSESIIPVPSVLHSPRVAESRYGSVTTFCGIPIGTFVSEDKLQYSDYTVRGFHVDYNGHVNNCRYLEFLEEARWVYFSSFLDPSKVHHQTVQIVVVRISIDFSAPLKLNDVFRVKNVISRIGNKSFTIKQTCMLTPAHEKVAEAEVTCVIVDKETQKALVLDQELALLVFDSVLDIDEIKALLPKQ